MIYLSLILFVIVIFLGYRKFYIERQITSLIKQLSEINKNKDRRKVTLGLSNKRLEILGELINESIDIRIQSEAERIKVEKDLRQTIANMSHDLRTPLTSIIGYLQLLKLDDADKAEKNEYLHTAEHRAKSLEVLLNDFYELSLIESLDYELNMEKLNISKVLQQIVLDRYSDFMERNIRPSINIPDKNFYIIAEKKSIERVIENILTNAIKYAKDAIDVSLTQEQGKLIITISNTFTNLSEKDMASLFDRFYMADKSRSGKGTGLGLAIAKGLVEKMDGSITAKINDDRFKICCCFKASI
ncbi:sensor histidine kinase [Clostridium manihotivorum]|uniref:histidine kinase n=1 Tax=Clostridium manihotivorum TaxID=2320868 RepID=A0A3R5QVL5_9CLOT|nr:HAMP domain-containing sensor histidine kinase [Clostridium manihotivorum]QAA33413.1 sensor histidine kinase [Clostridium manihotivorum]